MFDDNWLEESWVCAMRAESYAPCARRARHDGNLVKAAQALGLPSQYALCRLLRKYGVAVRGLREDR